MPATMNAYPMPAFLRSEPERMPRQDHMKRSATFSEKGSIVGFPWDSPYMDGYEAAKNEYHERIAKLEAENARLREALEKAK